MSTPPSVEHPCSITETAGSWSQAVSIGTSPVAVDTSGATNGGLAFTCTHARDCVILSDRASRSESGGSWGSPVALDLSGLPTNASFAVSGVACPTLRRASASGPYFMDATATADHRGWLRPSPSRPEPGRHLRTCSCTRSRSTTRSPARPTSASRSARTARTTTSIPHDVPVATTWSAGTWSPVASETSRFHPAPRRPRRSVKTTCPAPRRPHATPWARWRAISRATDLSRHIPLWAELCPRRSRPRPVRRPPGPLQPASQVVG